jgi:hypothetical protein
MATEYKVVRMVELFQWPGSWTQDSFEPEFAQGLAEALTRMAAEGWEYAGNYVYHQHLGAGYAIFRREAAEQVRGTGEIAREAGGRIHVTGEIVRQEHAP